MTKHFTNTSTKPYDRHTYKLQFPDGRHVVFDDYELLRAYRLQNARNWTGVTVDIEDKTNEVIDTTSKRVSDTKGFG